MSINYWLKFTYILRRTIGQIARVEVEAVFSRGEVTPLEDNIARAQFSQPFEGLQWGMGVLILHLEMVLNERRLIQKLTREILRGFVFFQLICWLCVTHIKNSVSGVVGEGGEEVIALIAGEACIGRVLVPTHSSVLRGLLSGRIAG
jgi:hypothetical protein